MVQILLGVPAFTKCWRLASTYLVIVSLIILREDLGHGTLFAADRPTSRVFLGILKLYWAQFLIYSALIAASDKVVLRR